MSSGAAAVAAATRGRAKLEVERKEAKRQETKRKFEAELAKLAEGKLGFAQAVAVLVFFAACCISYSGAFTGVYRKDMEEEWLGIIRQQQLPASEVVDFQARRLVWYSCGTCSRLGRNLVVSGKRRHADTHIVGLRAPS